jgi:hypothetical protein
MKSNNLFGVSNDNWISKEMSIIKKRFDSRPQKFLNQGHKSYKKMNYKKLIKLYQFRMLKRFENINDNKWLNSK